MRYGRRALVKQVAYWLPVEKHSTTRRAFLNIRAIDDPIDFTQVASKIRSSSNFRIAWQFFMLDEINAIRPTACRAFLEAIVSVPEWHAFLRDSFDDAYSPEFEIYPMHGHCEIRECTEDFVDTFAQAAFDLLGAYSRVHRRSTVEEREYIETLLSPLGRFEAYSIFAGTEENCHVCRQYDHWLFTNWFYDVAWDFAYFIVWPDRKIVCVCCLTDTD
jgi:hypothetical protein